MGPTAASRYHARMQRVLGHIDEHLDDDLSVAVLSSVAAFSPHQFQRQFAALFGIPVHRYVQLLRLKRASHRLAFRSDASVLQIALDSGFEGGEAFARAFRRRMDQTPSGVPGGAALGALARGLCAARPDTECPHATELPARRRPLG